jgi:hypothetical protein
VQECYELGVQAADILLPDSESLNLTERLNSILPVLSFFGTLRLCGNVFNLAKERNWFGEEGLKTFYQEYGNVSNVFTSSQASFENEVLDRLEPTIRLISAVGGGLDCQSIAVFVGVLKEHDDITKTEEMRLVQSNISKVQASCNEPQS